MAESVVQDTVHRVYEQSNNEEIATSSGQYDEASIQVDDPPMASFVVPKAGVYAEQLDVGTEFKVFRGSDTLDGEERFFGIVEKTAPVKGPSGEAVEVEGIHKGYALLQQHICDSYDFDEDDNPASVRDGVTINPWRFFIFRQAGATLSSEGEPLPIDGVQPDGIVKHLIGTRFIHQIDFRDNTYLLPSQVTDNSNNLAEVHRDGETGDLRPKLQLVRDDGGGFVAGDNVETIPLRSGDVNIDAMADIDEVTVTVIGEDDNGDIQLEASRNADDSSRNYSSTKSPSASDVTEDDGTTDTGLDKWTATFTDSDLPDTTNEDSLGIKIIFPGSKGDSSATKVHYMKVDCKLDGSDTGLSEGSIDSYSNPVDFRDDIDDAEWVELDFLTKNRLQSLETLRTRTESDDSVNPSPHWDVYIDASLDVHFEERRGVDVTDYRYEFDNNNIQEVSHEFDGREIAYQTIAYGAGSGKAQTRIVSQEEFSNGGLYDSDRDPDDAADPKYGERARVMEFKDPDEASATNLLRKARAFHQQHRDPLEQLRVKLLSEHIRFFSTGDSIDIFSPETRTNGTERVIRLTRSWDADSQEDLDVTLGDGLRDFAQAVASQRSQRETLHVRPQGAESETGLSGDGIPFDNSVFGVYQFAISEGAKIDRVKLKLTTLPWQAMAKPSAHTHDVDVTHPNHDHDVTHPSHDHDVSDTSTTDGSGLTLDSTESQSTSSVSDGSETDHTYTAPTVDGNGIIVITQVNTSGTNAGLTDKLSVRLAWNEADGTERVAVRETTEEDDGLIRYQFFIPSGAEGNSYTVTITNRTGSSQDLDSQVIWFGVDDHSHDVSDTSTTALGTTETSTTALGTTQSETTESGGALDYGIEQFLGDDGTGDPVYGENIEFAVDPTLGTDDLPSSFDSDKHPTRWGKAAASQTIEVDVTGYLNTDDNDVIQNGEHRVYLRTDADQTFSDNTDGLAVVSITPIIEVKQRTQGGRS